MATYFGISSDAASTLFSSLNGKSNSTSSYLGDYASIKNGSYQKLLKSYYAKEDEQVTTEKTAEDFAISKKQLTLLRNDATELYKATKQLTEDSSDKNVKAFVEAYNNVVDATKESEIKTITRNAEAMTKISNINAELFGDVGIIVGIEGKLTFDEDAFAKADESTIETLFSGMNSYAADILSRSSNIITSAVNEINKANSYDNKGSYSNIDSIGNLYDTLF